MRQFQFSFKGKEALVRELRKINQWSRTKIYSHMLFQVFMEDPDRETAGLVMDEIKKELPEAMVFGCSTNGQVMNGELSKHKVGITCTVFEYPTTRVQIMQYELTTETEEAVTADLLRILSENDWVTAIELLVTIRGMSMTGFSDRLRDARSDIAIFGGGAFNADMNSDDACVFSSVGGYAERGVIFVLMGGEDLHVETTYITGWKPLGRELEITRVKDSVLYEIEKRPAYDTYFRYLNIENDEHFFENTLEFPFIFDHNGIQLLRAPTASMGNGALLMTSDMYEGDMARIAYGDPETILREVANGIRKLNRFAPEVIKLYSCGARRTFWGTEVSRETAPFQLLAPTSGFFTSGEFLRTKGHLNQHNVTLVVGALREGEAPEHSTMPSLEDAGMSFSGRVSMVNRLATFIQAATEELEAANRKLGTMAISDGMTRLYNRMEIQRRITEAVKEPTQSVSLIMMDVDDFKKVNDTYGHAEGDQVLIRLAEMLKRTIDKSAPGGVAGRWGGEEFMVLLQGIDQTRASELAEQMRVNFSEIEFGLCGHRTMSLGVAEFRPGETADAFAMRVDDRLYKAKKSGKNCVVCE
ncbi:MAG: GGDEF domain-containing protein [Eubacterium sp.]|nr:GGDEF domain-containing protein [Eubacterium sp.]